MRNCTLLFILLTLANLSGAAAQQPTSGAGPSGRTRGASCLTQLPSGPTRMAACAQIAASAALTPLPAQRPAESSVHAARGAGKGALVGLGLGLGVGALAALIFGPSCEEGHAGCTAGLVIGGAALGAGVGALLGALDKD